MGEETGRNLVPRVSRLPVTWQPDLLGNELQDKKRRDPGNEVELGKDQTGRKATFLSATAKT